MVINVSYDTIKNLERIEISISFKHSKYAYNCPLTSLKGLTKILFPLTATLSTINLIDENTITLNPPSSTYRNALKRIARHDDQDCSKESILNMMDRFVKTVSVMDDTILIPSRLMDREVSFLDFPLAIIRYLAITFISYLIIVLVVVNEVNIRHLVHL